ncbi:Uncharacterised protein [Mycobacteroides abscessus subsp. abscessus]|uniref:hypothetical protein n=1 Tax=Mycobacteroides abscessus TaxID=36809 RepID=UPI00092C5EF5|nr:hypothetical protein [Mycobacteroides abscessus]SHX98984.1 Uncharacterised protein [Mycobacteroides abscessus subsp. abscessus]SIC80770.1 Uncharacterised protein [Mycobacteroides abscessus subsp. abscessus]SKP25840.1 Uncharacterised protein [Mycobacteroides abscessus subsp. abscessus]
MSTNPPSVSPAEALCGLRLEVPVAGYQAAVEELSKCGCGQPAEALRAVLDAAGYRLRVVQSLEVAALGGPWAVDIGRDDDDAPVYINLDDFRGRDVCLFTGAKGRGKRTKVKKLLAYWEAKGARIIVPAEKKPRATIAINSSGAFLMATPYGDLLETVGPRELGTVLADIEPGSGPVVLVLDPDLFSFDTRREFGMYGPAVDLRQFDHVDELHVLAVNDSNSFHPKLERRRFAEWAEGTEGWHMSVGLNIHCIWGIRDQTPFWDAYAEVPGRTVAPRWFTPDITPISQARGRGGKVEKK